MSLKEWLRKLWFIDYNKYYAAFKISYYYSYEETEENITYHTKKSEFKTTCTLWLPNGIKAS